MEKIIFFGLVIPILGFVLYLGATAIMRGFSAKSANITILQASISIIRLIKINYFKAFNTNSL